MGAFSIGFTVTLLVRTTRGRPSKSFVCAAAFDARPSAQQATNKRGNSLQTITGFWRSPYSIFVLLAQREVRASPFYPPAPPWDNSQCDRFFKNSAVLIPESNLSDEIKRRFPETYLANRQNNDQPSSIRRPESVLLLAQTAVGRTLSVVQLVFDRLECV